MKYFVWFAILGTALRPVSSSCETATSAVSASCAAAGAIAGGVGGITCAATLGIGCAVAIAGAATAATCDSIAGNIDCSGGTEPSGAEIMAKLDEIVGFLENIEDTVDKIYNEVELGFFEQKYNEYINKIRAADARHKIDVLEKSVDPAKPGLIMDTQWARDWATDVLGDGDYNCRGALDMIDQMVVGAPSITGRMTPSVYTLASEQNLCSLQLYDLISSLITQGSTLVFNAMEIRGDKFHDADVKQLQDRLVVNNATFIKECSKMVAGGAETWGSWSSGNQNGDAKKQICPKGVAVTGMTWREQNGYGIVDLTMDCDEYSVRLTGNNGGSNNRKMECKDTGKYNGFTALQGREQNGYGIVNVETLCSGTGSSAWIVSNGNYAGSYNGEKHCSTDAVVTGIEVRDQWGYGIVNFRARCTKLTPKPIPATPPPSERKTSWTSWSNGNTAGSVRQKLCPRNYAVQSMQWGEQTGYGIVDLFLDCGYGQEIRLTGNNGGSRRGKKTCTSLTNYGFYSVQGREQTGYGLVNANMKCTGESVATDGTGNYAGSWNKAYSCPTGYIITGMEVREQTGYGIVNMRSHCTEWTV